MKLNKIDKLLGKLSLYLDRIAGIAMLFLVFLFTANIILRAVWQPINFAYDLSGLVSTIVVAFSIAYCTYENGHVRVDLLFAKFPKKVQRVIEVCYSFAAMLTFGYCTYALVKYTIKSFANEMVSMTNKIPFGPFAVCVTIGFFVMTLVMILQFIKLVTRKEETE